MAAAKNVSDGLQYACDAFKTVLDNLESDRLGAPSTVRVEKDGNGRLSLIGSSDTHTLMKMEVPVPAGGGVSDQMLDVMNKVVESTREEVMKIEKRDYSMQDVLAVVASYIPSTELSERFLADPLNAEVAKEIMRDVVLYVKSKLDRKGT